jgi:hypothetical protein
MIRRFEHACTTFRSNRKQTGLRLFGQRWGSNPRFEQSRLRLLAL